MVQSLRFRLPTRLAGLDDKKNKGAMLMRAIIPKRRINCLVGLGAASSLSLAATLMATEAHAASCADMAALKIKDATILSATVVSGGSFTADTKGARAVTGLPTFCRVYASVRPTSDSDIRVEVWLPATGWNGKYDGIGSNGLGGNIHYPEMGVALARGYATSATDTGHNNDAGDGVWAAGHPEKIIDFGYRSTHLTALLAKDVIKAFYGDAPKYSYFEGCSQGGQEAIMEAQRFPTDYDGIAAGDADYAATHHEIGGHLFVPWLMNADDPNFAFSATKAKALGDAVNLKCDGLDGVVDGVIENPQACHFDPATIQCANTGDGPDCLSPREVAIVNALYKGADQYMGNGFYGGYVPGSEAATWRGFIVGGAVANNQHGRVGFPFFKYFYNDPNWDFSKWDWKTDPARIMNAKVGNETMSSIMDVTSADISALAARKGKLIQYHGWGDSNVSPITGVRFHDRVVAALKAKNMKADDSYRLFMVPGMGHCQGGPGPDKFDMLTALESWVEHGKAPDSIPAAHETAGKVDRTRILCPYPMVAKYDGKGPKDQASSFACRAA